MLIFHQITKDFWGKYAFNHTLDMKWIEINLKYCILTLISSLEQKKRNIQCKIWNCPLYACFQCTVPPPTPIQLLLPGEAVLNIHVCIVHHRSHLQRRFRFNILNGNENQWVANFPNSQLVSTQSTSWGKNTVRLFKIFTVILNALFLFAW